MESKVDLFTSIHKAIRTLIYHTGTKLQTTNFLNPSEAGDMLSELDIMLELLAEHAAHEDETIFPPIEVQLPGISGQLEQQHKEGELKLSDLQNHIQKMRSDSHLMDYLVVRKLNILFTDFISFYLWHMNREEESILPASQDVLTQEELKQIRTKIQVSMPVDRYDQWMRWMLPSLTITELITLYQQLKMNAPAQIFKRISEIGRMVLDGARWETINNELAEVSVH